MFRHLLVLVALCFVALLLVDSPPPCPASPELDLNATLPPLPPQARDLVFAAGPGLDRATLYRYVGSLRRHMPHVEVVVFTDLEVRDMEFNATLLPYEVSAEERAMGVVRSRFFLFKRWLDAVPEGAYRDVLHTDFADVGFQDDVFARVRRAAPTAALVFAMEAKWKTIGECRFNGPWVRGCATKEQADAMWRESISCAGTTFGSLAGMRRYLKEMTAKLLACPLERSNDQGVHNILINTGAFADIETRKEANEGSPLCTLGYQKAARADRWGNVLNEQGGRCALVHQYNRVPVIEQLINQRWALPGEAGVDTSHNVGRLLAGKTSSPK